MYTYMNAGSAVNSDADNSEDTIFYVDESMHSYKNVESLIIFRIKESKKST